MEVFHGLIGSLAPFLAVAFVAGINPALFRNLHVGVREQELANARVQCKAVHAVACGEHQHGGRTIEEVACSHLLCAGAQHLVQGNLACMPFGTAVDGEDGADIDIHVHVGGAVQGVKDDDVVAARELGPHPDEIGIFLAGHGADGAAALHAVDKDAVGQLVYLLDSLALHVNQAGSAQYVEKACLVDAL